MASRRFPPPWTVEDIGAAFVTDSAGQKLAYVYLEDEPGRKSAAAKDCSENCQAAGVIALRKGELIKTAPKKRPSGQDSKARRQD